MCNPRQIRILATHHLAEAWDAEVRRQVTLHGEAVGRAAVRERLAGSLGRPVLAALDQVLDAAPGWREVDGGYRHDLEGGYVHYHADTGELEIVALLQDVVEAAGEAGTRISGSVEESLEIEGVGRYYDDGWGGYTEDTARQDAEVDARARLELATAERLARARTDAEEGISESVRLQAEAEARIALEAARAARAAELDEGAEQQLASVGVQARQLFHQALAEAYRDAILAYARSRRAEGVRISDGDGVLNIEFEMEM